MANCFDRFYRLSPHSLHEPESLEAAAWKKIRCCPQLFFQNKPLTKKTCGIKWMLVQLSTCGGFHARLLSVEWLESTGWWGGTDVWNTWVVGKWRKKRCKMNLGTSVPKSGFVLFLNEVLGFSKLFPLKFLKQDAIFFLKCLLVSCNYWVHSK